MSRLVLDVKNWKPTGRLCVCVLLTCLVVYNPFVAATTTSSHLSYSQMARNRATVGSSELKKFSPVPDPVVQPDPDAEVRGADPAVTVREHDPGMVPCETTDWPPELCASLWFRPPPKR